MAAPFSPTAARLQPRKMENTTICRISLRAIASIMLVGTACEIKTFSVKGSDCTAATAPASCATKLMPAPGWNILTMTRPNAIDNNEAQINRKKVLENIRPSVLASPILAIPTTNVEITRGAIIIFTMRKNMVVKIEMSWAYDFAVSADAILLMATPAIMPSIRPNMIILVKLIFFMFAPSDNGWRIMCRAAHTRTQTTAQVRACYDQPHE